MSAEPARSAMAGLDRIRAVADAVLYEGYLLYPYRATSRKNQVRWQFGVLGPEGADIAGIGEDSHLSMDCLLDVLPTSPSGDAGRAHASTSAFCSCSGGVPSKSMIAEDTLQSPNCGSAAERWFSWDEAVEVECSRTVLLADLVSEAPGPWLAEARRASSRSMIRAGGCRSVVRRRWPVAAAFRRGWSPSLACIGSPWPSTIRRRSMGSAGEDDAVRQFAARHPHDHRVSRSAGCVRLGDRSAD